MCAHCRHLSCSGSEGPAEGGGTGEATPSSCSCTCCGRSASWACSRSISPSCTCAPHQLHCSSSGGLATQLTTNAEREGLPPRLRPQLPACGEDSGRARRCPHHTSLRTSSCAVVRVPASVALNSRRRVSRVPTPTCTARTTSALDLWKPAAPRPRRTHRR